MTSSLGRPWVSRAVLAGFAGTVMGGLVLVAGYMAAVALGESAGGVFGSWVAALARNPATETVGAGLSLAMLLHLAVGLMFALFYAAFVAPRLTGPGWRKGALFALGPWLLSLVLFLPAVGGGLFGLGLGAGLLPILGNLIAHLAYGVTLGEVYERDLADQADDNAATARANRMAEGGVAVGVVGGGLLGAAAAMVLSALGLATGGMTLLLGGAAGATLGGFLGSYAGLSRAGLEPERGAAVPAVVVDHSSDTAAAQFLLIALACVMLIAPAFVLAAGVLWGLAVLLPFIAAGVFCLLLALLLRRRPAGPGVGV